MTLDKHTAFLEPEFNANMSSSPSYTTNKFAKYAFFSSMFQVTGLYFSYSFQQNLEQGFCHRMGGNKTSVIEKYKIRKLYKILFLNFVLGSFDYVVCPEYVH